MTCRQAMTADPVVCLPSDTAARAAERMRAEDVGSIPVVNDTHEKRLLGIVTDRDLALQVVAEGKAPQDVLLESVMTHNPVAVRADDDYQTALDLMSRHQVRRIPVVDDDGLLVGILAQADVARQSPSSEATGEVVEEISQPKRSALGRTLGRVVPGRGAAGISTYLWASLGVAAGAAAIALLDSQRGRERRRWVQDRAASLTGRSRESAAAGTSGPSGTPENLLHTSDSWRNSRGEAVDDDQLVSSIRSVLGSQTRSAGRISVVAEGGNVTLRGSALPGEVATIVRAVYNVPGVCSVENRLSAAGDVPQRGFVSDHAGAAAVPGWSPTMRLACGALGGGLAWYGLQNRRRMGSFVGNTAATVGLGLVARSAANRTLPGVGSWSVVTITERY